MSARFACCNTSHRETWVYVAESITKGCCGKWLSSMVKLQSDSGKNRR